MRPSSKESKPAAVHPMAAYEPPDTLSRKGSCAGSSARARPWTNYGWLQPSSSLADTLFSTESRMDGMGYADTVREKKRCRPLTRCVERSKEEIAASH